MDGHSRFIASFMVRNLKSTNRGSVGESTLMEKNLTRPLTQEHAIIDASGDREMSITGCNAIIHIQFLMHIDHRSEWLNG